MPQPTLSRRAMLALSAGTVPAVAAGAAAAASGIPAETADPVASPGRIVHWRNVTSAHVAPRDVSIWIPSERSGPLPVIYAHDGRDLFDTAVSIDDWPLELDRAMGTLMAEGLRPAIVVGIWSTDDRPREYNAPSILADLPPDIAETVELSTEGPLLTEPYLKFIIEELKPQIDAEFDTLTGPEHTYTYGVSMGGLVAIESLATRPDVFSRAAGMSAHMFLFGPASGAPGFPFPPSTPEEMPKALARFAERFPAPDGRKLWICRGSTELDAMYEPTHMALINGLLEKGWEPVTQLEARAYYGAGHHGRFWAPRRVLEAMRFLLEDQPG